MFRTDLSIHSRVRQCAAISPDAVSADSERMTVGMSEVELANAPRFVCGRHRYLEA
jgi:hypothetical protein